VTIRAAPSPSSSDDLTVVPRLGRDDVQDLLSRTCEADLAVQAEVGPRSPGRRAFDLAAMIPLNDAVPRLDDAGGDRHERGQWRADLVEPGLGLALDLDRRAVDRDRLRKGDRRQAQQLGRAGPAWSPCSRPVDSVAASTRSNGVRRIAAASTLAVPRASVP